MALLRISVTGMSHLPLGLPVGSTGRSLSAALSLSLTGAIMVLLGISHPPAGATTMIVSLGIISKPDYLVTIEVAVILLTAQALAINQLAGLAYPIWQTAKRIWEPYTRDQERISKSRMGRSGHKHRQPSRVVVSI